jgi:hypothetical protein
MSDATARLSLPFIMPGQAQKELYHNEALARIDMALHAAVEGQPLATPPADPAVGQGWIVGGGATANGAARTKALPAGPKEVALCGSGSGHVRLEQGGGVQDPLDRFRLELGRVAGEVACRGGASSHR